MIVADTNLMAYLLIEGERTEIARGRLSAYDAHFVAAAIDLAVPLVTSDRRMLKQCPDLAVAPERFA